MRSRVPSIVETPTEWRIETAGAVVTRLAFDYAFTLFIEEALEVRFETHFELVEGDRAERLDPEATATLAPLLTLHQVKVEDFTVSKAGELRLQLADDRRLQTSTDPEYEAFTVSAGEGRFKLVALPGGDIAVWS